MGYQVDTEFFYGAHVPRHQYSGYATQEGDRLDGIIAGYPKASGTGLGHITAGDYDDDELFLCVVPDGESSTVELGDWRTTNAETHAFSILHWDSLITDLATLAGYEVLGPIGWTVVPNKT